MSKKAPTRKKPAQVRAPAASRRMPLLMPDDFSELNLCTWRVEPGARDPDNPLIEGCMPWDRGGVGGHGSVFKDPLDGRWKAYVVCTPAEEFTESESAPPDKPWASENHAFRRICLFESDDGVHWVRPRLINEAYEDHEKTNIIFDLSSGASTYASVMVDPANEKWPYEMIVLQESWCDLHGKPPEGNGYYPYRSKDGKAWERAGGKVSGPMTGDLCFFYRVGGALTPFPAELWEPSRDEAYVAYYRLPGTPQPQDHLPIYEDCPRRSCYRATSRDGQTWVKDDLMELTADERDHRDTQYQECVPLAVPGGCIAMVTMYHPISQTLDVRVAASRDGRRWWFPDRRPCLPNAPMGDYGGGMIWQGQYLIVENGRLFAYHGGTEGAHRQISDTRAPSVEIDHQETVIDHGTHFIPFNGALCRASWRFDRLYALVASAGGPTLGTAVTRPRDLTGKTMSVNILTRPPKKSGSATCDEGRLQVELLDAEGRVLPGFTREDCAALHGDHRVLQVTWTGGDRAPAGAAKAKLYLKRTLMYGFEFV